jgi:hypothetical protein
MVTVGLGVQTLIDGWKWQQFRKQCELEYPGNFWKEYAHIFAPNRQLANILWREKGEELADAAFRFRRRLVRIFWSLSDQDKPIPIRPRPKQQVVGNCIMSNIVTDPYNTPVAPELDINWQDCWNSQDAMWVVHQATQKVLYANPAAIAANGNKPPTEILNAEINALWEDEALDSLTRLVNRTTGWLREHSNTGFRWQRNSEDGGVIWTRSRREFHVDYHKINYLGLECRFEHVKAALPV